jgi:uncharacterized SAM-binding protein YcdF (DUF218 family)
MKKKWLMISFLFLIVTICTYSFLSYTMNRDSETTANGEKPYLIILGAKIKESGEPSLALKNRLDVSIDYLKTYPHVNVIVTGGQGPNEPDTEANVMYHYLIAHGIDANRIQKEAQSTSTYENLAFSKALLDGQLTEATIATNDFHLSRARYLAKQLNIETDGLAASTPKVVEQKSRLRERLALLKAYILGK